MTIEFSCPRCGRTLRTRDQDAGRDAKCPECGEVVRIPPPTSADSAEPTEWAAEVEAGEFDSGQRGPEEQAPCPVCGEMIPVTAPQCPYCGEVFEGHAAAGGPAMPTPISSGDVFSTGWEIYKANFGPCILAVLVVFVLNFVSRLPGEFLQSQIRNGGGQNGGLIALLALVSIAASVFQIFLQLGQMVFFLKIARGERAEIGDIFSGGRFLLRMIGSSIVFGLMVFVGLILLIVPGIIVALMFWPFGYVLVDQDPPGLDALWRAKEFTQGNWGAAFVIGLVGLLLTLLGALMCGVGLLFTVPLVTMYVAVAYLKMTGQRTVLDRDYR